MQDNRAMHEFQLILSNLVCQSVFGGVVIPNLIVAVLKMCHGTMMVLSIQPNYCWSFDLSSHDWQHGAKIPINIVILRDAHRVKVKLQIVQHQNEHRMADLFSA